MVEQLSDFGALHRGSEGGRLEYAPAFLSSEIYSSNRLYGPSVYGTNPMIFETTVQDISHMPSTTVSNPEAPSGLPDLSGGPVRDCIDWNKGDSGYMSELQVLGSQSQRSTRRSNVSPVDRQTSDFELCPYHQISPHPLTSGGRSYTTGPSSLSRVQRSAYRLDSLLNRPDLSSYLQPPSSSAEASWDSSDVNWSSFSLQQPAPSETYLQNSAVDALTQNATSFGQSDSKINAHVRGATSVPDTPEAPNSSKRNFPSALSVPNLCSSLISPPTSPPSSPFPLYASPTPYNHRPQALRFPGDLYTPPYIRNHGPLREGWCGICKPGKWLVLKNSAFWYDKSFTHGISAASGTPFEGPSETRLENSEGGGDGGDRSGDLEGKCGTCGVWVGLGGRRRGRMGWFRHAYKVSFPNLVVSGLKLDGLTTIIVSYAC